MSNQGRGGAIPSQKSNISIDPFALKLPKKWVSFHIIGLVTSNVFNIIGQVILDLDFLLTRASCSYLVTLWRLCCVLIHLMSVNLWKLFETVSSNSERALSLFLDTHYVAETDMINIKSSCYRKIWRLWSIPKYCTLLSRIISKILMVHNICRDRGFAPFTVGTRKK